LYISKLHIEKHEKLLLFVLKEHGADTEPFPASLERLSNLCSLSRRKVNDALSDLKERGLVVVEVGQGKAANKYKLNIC
jgi:biotin operon repressor